METPVATYKILILGESGVGKTSFFKTYVDESFNSTTKPTIGFDYDSKILTVDNKTVKLAMWDTAGQERFRSLTPLCYRNVRGAILMFDVNSRKSLTKLEDWFTELEIYSEDSHIIKIIVGSKIDLSDRKVTAEDVESLCKKHNVLYFEVSSKTNKGVQIVFEELARKMMALNTPQDSQEKICLKKEFFFESFKGKTITCFSAAFDLATFPYYYFFRNYYSTK